jgi:predicted ABC-type ATPase
LQKASLRPRKAGKDLWLNVRLVGNAITIGTLTVDSYIAADIAELLRRTLLAQGFSFTYETVMSHPGKVEFMDLARRTGYRVYLYYVATEDPEINISRVNVRVSESGHGVPPDTVRSRYFKSLGLLKQAIKQTNRAYLFDNSGQTNNLIAEVTEGKTVYLIDQANVPTWFLEYVKG